MGIFDFLKRKKKKEFRGRDYGTQRMVGSPDRIKTTDKPPMQMPKPPGLTPGAKSVPHEQGRHSGYIEDNDVYLNNNFYNYNTVDDTSRNSDSYCPPSTTSSDWSSGSSSSSCYDSGSSSSYDSGSSSSSSYDSGSSY